MKVQEILSGRASGALDHDERLQHRLPIPQLSGDYGALLRHARSASKKSRPAVVMALKRVGVMLTTEAIKKHELGKSIPRPAARKGYAAVYRKAEELLFPGVLQAIRRPKNGKSASRRPAQ